MNKANANHPYGDQQTWGAGAVHMGTVEPRPFDIDERAHLREAVERYAVQVVAHSYILPEVEALLDTLQAAGVLVVRQFGSSDIAAARSQAATHWHDDHQGRSVLLWLDSDTWIHPISAFRLLMAAERENALVTAVSPSRNVRRVLPVVAAPDEPFVLGAPGQLVPCLFAGFGCVAHPINVLEKLALFGDVVRVRAGWLTFFAPIVMRATSVEPAVNYDYLSEDWAFWHRAREAKVRCLLDPEPRVLHFGSWPYQWEDSLFEPRPLYLEIPIGDPSARQEATTAAG